MTDMTGWQRLKRRYSAISQSAFAAYLRGATLSAGFFFGFNVLCFLIIAEFHQPAIWGEDFTLASVAKSLTYTFVIGPIIGILNVRSERSRKGGGADGREG